MAADWAPLGRVRGPFDDYMEEYGPLGRVIGPFDDYEEGSSANFFGELDGYEIGVFEESIFYDDEDEGGFWDWDDADFDWGDYDFDMGSS